jgi:type I restriction enzyme S subunit
MRDAWPTTTLGDVATIAVSGVDKHIVSGEVSVRLCNYLDVYRNRRLTSSIDYAPGSATAAEVRRFALKKGDVLITKDSETPDDIGIPSVVMDDLPNTVCGYHLALVRPRDAVNPVFLAYLFESDVAKRHFLRTANGVTRFGIGIAAISSLPMSLPPREEQASIASILGALDDELESARAAVEGARVVQRTLLADLLARGVCSDGQLRDGATQGDDFVASKAGTLPDEWTISTVGSEFALQNGITLNEERRLHLQKHPYLRVANVRRYELDLTDVQELGAEDSELADRILREGDLLVVEGHADRMQIGRCALVTAEAAGMTFQNHLFRLRTRGRISPEFADLWLNSSYAQRYWNARCGTSSGLNTINQRNLRQLLIPVPTAQEQSAITKMAAAQRTHGRSLVARVSALQTLRRSLMVELLTGRVRVGRARSQERVPQ